MRTINRRDLLLLSGSTLILGPTLVHATIPPPPASLWYLIFIRDGVYKITGFYTVTLPASYGTCQNYDEIDVSQAVRGLFTFTGASNVSPWQMLIGSPSYEWWEVLDKRNGRIFRLWKYDRFEVRFADKSRVKVVFQGGKASTLFWPLAGSERRPDGTLLNPPDRRGTLGGDGKSRDGEGGATPVRPSNLNFLWSPAPQLSPLDADQPW